MIKNDKRDPFRIDRRAASRLAGLGDQSKGHCQRLDDVGRALGFRDGKTMMSLLKAEEGSGIRLLAENAPHQTALEHISAALANERKIFELPLGKLLPSEDELSLLTQLIGHRLAKHGFPISPMTTGFLRICLEEAYAFCADKGANTYLSEVSILVDEALIRLYGRLPEGFSWYEVSALLRAAEETEAARVAQLQGSPSLHHLVRIASESNVTKRLYKDEKTEHGVLLMESFSQAISATYRDMRRPDILQGYPVPAKGAGNELDLRPWLSGEPISVILATLSSRDDWAELAAEHLLGEPTKVRASKGAAAFWLVQYGDLSALNSAERKQLAVMALG